MVRLWIKKQPTGDGASDQEQILQLIRDAIAADPTIVLRTVETVVDLAGVNRQIAVVDNDMDPDQNGIYGYVSIREWRKLSSVQQQ